MSGDVTLDSDQACIGALQEDFCAPGKETMLTGYLESITTLRNYAGPITLKVRAKMQLSVPIYSLSTANNQFDPIQGK